MQTRQPTAGNAGRQPAGASVARSVARSSAAPAVHDPAAPPPPAAPPGAPLGALPAALRRAARGCAAVRRVLRTVVGAPDYDRYVAHSRSQGPGAPVLDRAAFARERLAARYDRPGSRCC